jgi:hypothetical protein
MGFLGRFRGKKESPEPAKTPGPPQTRAEAAARHLSFAGESAMGRTVEEVVSVADAL